MWVFTTHSTAAAIQRRWCRGKRGRDIIIITVWLMLFLGTCPSPCAREEWGRTNDRGPGRGRWVDDTKADTNTVAGKTEIVELLLLTGREGCTHIQIFSVQVQLRSTKHPKFDSTEVRTHDLQIMVSAFHTAVSVMIIVISIVHVHETLVVTTGPLDTTTDRQSCTLAQR